MPLYVDGFVIPVSRKNLARCRKVSKAASRVWLDHGALEYVECVGDDLKAKGMLSFLQMAKAKAGQTVVFSWIVYKSRVDRNKVNAKVMADKRLASMMKGKMPFDVTRMAFGGFKVMIKA